MTEASTAHDDVAHPAVSFEDVRAPADRSSLPVDARRWSEFIERVLTTVLADLGTTVLMSVSVTLVDEHEIALLKDEHLGGDGRPTDVLAFPLDEVPLRGASGPAVDEPPLILGDIVVCPSVAAAQAPAHAGAFPDELALLLVHAILHLVGHDHDAPEETIRMRQAEQRLLELHFGPLIGDPWCEPTDPRARTSS